MAKFIKSKFRVLWATVFSFFYGFFCACAPSSLEKIYIYICRFLKIASQSADAPSRSRSLPNDSHREIRRGFRGVHAAAHLTGAQGTPRQGPGHLLCGVEQAGGAVARYGDDAAAAPDAVEHGVQLVVARRGHRIIVTVVTAANILLLTNFYAVP